MRTILSLACILFVAASSAAEASGTGSGIRRQARGMHSHRLEALLTHQTQAPNTSTVPHTVYACRSVFCSDMAPNMTDAVGLHAAPGMVVGAIDADPSSPLVIAAVGRHTYEPRSAVITDASQYDMASCSKVMGATTAAAILYQQGLLDLDAPVASPSLLGPGFATNGKGPITVRNLLLHNAGFPPDPSPGYSDPAFPCAENQHYHPGQNFDCTETIYASLLANQTLINPPGSTFVYSDLSMITLMFVVATVVRNNNLVTSLARPCLREGNLVCLYNAFLQQRVWGPLQMTSTEFVPENSEVNPPEWDETALFRHQLVKGFVSDQNAYALGGISGHAGVFTTVYDALTLMRMWTFESHPQLLNATTIRLFTTVANLTQSSRALGWDTNDQAIHWCGTMSKQTFLHIGFTGTALCGDPVTGIASAVLANGRYPDFSNDGMIWYRPNVNALVHDLYERIQK